jgi:hypothetical protein
MNEADSCGSKDQSCESGIVKNILKVGLIILLGLSLFIYMIMLVTGMLGGKPEVQTKVSTPAEIATAKNVIETELKNPMIKAFQETDTSLIIIIHNDKWKKLKSKDKKEFVQKLGLSRGIIGLNPSVKVIDERSIEHASFEHNRISIGDF